jgi:hypothetical protein
MNWPNRFGFIANFALCLMAGYFILRHGLDSPQATWSYSDLVAVLLTAIGVILTTLGLGIAALAIWGYQKIADHAETQSVAAVNKRLDAMLADQNLKQRISDMVQPHIAQAADAVWEDNFAVAAYPPGEGQENAG